MPVCRFDLLVISFFLSSFSHYQEAFLSVWNLVQWEQKN